MNEQLTWYRLGLLVRNDIIGGYRSILMTSAVLAIFIILNATLLVGFGHTEQGYYPGWFIGMLLIWGTISASGIFSELHNKTRNESYLLLPASALEKTVARILYVSVLFVTYLLLFTMLVSMVSEGINLMMFGRYNELFNPFDPQVWDVIGRFLVLQSVFFLGGAWFRSRHWLKTVLSVSVIGIGFGILALIAFRIFFADFFIGLVLPAPELFVAITKIFNSNSVGLFYATAIGTKFRYFGLLAPFCWFVAWLRVRETEVSHGV